MAVNYAVETNPQSTYIRLVSIPYDIPFCLPENYIFEKGKGAVLTMGDDAILFSYGPVMLSEACKAADILQKGGHLGLKVVNLPWLNNFDIEFRGLTASPSCIMIRGFPKCDTLNKIRSNLRYNFKNSGLQQSIDSRYFIQSAHSTIVRFKERLKRKEDFLKHIEKYTDHYFGKTNVDKMELVYNDWYQRAKYVKKIHEFYI